MNRKASDEERKDLIRWCVIGDSFTYLNDHLDETGYRVTEGYISRTCRKVSGLFPINLGKNGSATPDWLEEKLPEADLYTVLLGTNDWHTGVPLGTQEDFEKKREGSILGNLAVILSHIRQAGPDAKIIVMNPVERGDFDEPRAWKLCAGPGANALRYCGRHSERLPECGDSCPGSARPLRLFAGDCRAV